MIRLAVLLLAGAALAGCATAPPIAACPAGQTQFRTAQLFLGRKAPGATVNVAEVQRFIDTEIRPRFTEGVTVLDGGPRWQGAENMLVRDAAKVVTFPLPAAGDRQGRVEAVRTAYRAKFGQDSVVVIGEPACVEL